MKPLLGFIAVIGDMFRKTFVTPVHEMLDHVFGKTTRFRPAAHGFGHFTDMDGSGTATNAQIADIHRPGIFREFPNFIPIAVQWIEGRGKSPAVR